MLRRGGGKVDIDTTGTWVIVIIGAAIALMALVALYAPRAYVDEGMIAVGGVGAFIARGCSATPTAPHGRRGSTEPWW